ncbi:hypothetical protein Rsub_11229 [Raphidocelis subcapitata]|uniref:Protein kinase domain-containing protein n=1 Tax=Raphidocelis subcapitata TaxID=307507 RepID=A0A2V0PMN3_9CHLO|nr:hypothetical protein Rsub_11229 [Raphidocelis subcapitata]|eukprot:GBF98335.1 hypothetical protein Rsub_11229 [Raphidocelis subcapitata]
MAGLMRASSDQKASPTAPRLLAKPPARSGGSSACGCVTTRPAGGRSVSFADDGREDGTKAAPRHGQPHRRLPPRRCDAHHLGAHPRGAPPAPAAAAAAAPAAAVASREGALALIEGGRLLSGIEGKALVWAVSIEGAPFAMKLTKSYKGNQELALRWLLPSRWVQLPLAQWRGRPIFPDWRARGITRGGEHQEWAYSLHALSPGSLRDALIGWAHARRQQQSSPQPPGAAPLPEFAPLPPGAFPPLAARMAAAVGAVHAGGLRHGSIKASKFLISGADGRLMLSDLSRAGPASQHPMSFPPQPGCPAPEQLPLAGDASWSPAAAGARREALRRFEGDAARGRAAGGCLRARRRAGAAVESLSRPEPARRRWPLRVRGGGGGGQAPEGVPPVLADLLRSMLHPDPRRRATIRGVKRHPFFSATDWPAVERRRDGGGGGGGGAADAAAAAAADGFDLAALAESGRQLLADELRRRARGEAAPPPASAPAPAASPAPAPAPQQQQPAPAPAAAAQAGGEPQQNRGGRARRCRAAAAGALSGALWPARAAVKHALSLFK